MGSGKRHPGADRFDTHPLFLRFRDEVAEQEYVSHTLDRTLTFCRGAWVLVLFLGGTFAVLDGYSFGERAGAVLVGRAMLMSLAALALGVSFLPGWKRLMVWNAPVFITCSALFCTMQVCLDDPGLFSPYSTGLFFAFAGIFSTAGLRSAHSLLAMVLSFLVFAFAVAVVSPVNREIFLVYSFFLPGIILVFGYAGYLVERISRDSFSASARLGDSLAMVKRLSGLLPICASCKRIRDDGGYWDQVDHYISRHSEAEFTHGLCPDCTTDLYPDLRLEAEGESEDSRGYPPADRRIG